MSKEHELGFIDSHSAQYPATASSSIVTDASELRSHVAEFAKNSDFDYTPTIGRFCIFRYDYPIAALTNSAVELPGAHSGSVPDLGGKRERVEPTHGNPLAHARCHIALGMIAGTVQMRPLPSHSQVLS